MAEEQVNLEPGVEEQLQQEQEPIRTLFMSGLPKDVMPREVHNIARFLGGFQHCTLNANGAVPTAFIAFDSETTASEAKERLHNQPFDEQCFPDYTMRVEWAKKNSMGKRDRVANGARKRARTDENGAAAGGGGTVTTLFVANLGPNANEQELGALFYSQPGVKTFKFNSNRSRGAVAFVDFNLPQQAADCRRVLNGAVLSSSGNSGGLRIEFAKNSMGRSASSGVGGGLNHNPHAAAAHAHAQAQAHAHAQHAAMAMGQNPYAASMGGGGGGGAYGGPPPQQHMQAGMGMGGYGGFAPGPGGQFGR